MKNGTSFFFGGIFALGLLLLYASCDEAIETVSELTDDQPDSTEAGDYLMFRNFNTISGTAPTVPADNPIKINVRDSLFVVKGHAYMARVAMFHDQTINIIGSYVEIPTSDYYYDVPEESPESNDSTSVIYINLQPSDDGDIEYPYTVHIKIKPYDADGVPLKVFEKSITVEDPHDPSKCSIMTEDGTAWRWRFTERINVQEEVVEVTAPNYQSIVDQSSIPVPAVFSGCCVSGSYVPAGEATGFDGTCDNQNPHYRKVDYNSLYLVNYAYLFLFSSGNFIHYAGSTTHIFIPSKSICANDAVYESVRKNYTKTGTHDYTLDAIEMTLFTEFSDPSSGGPQPPRGFINFTCHTLIFTVAQVSIIYQRYSDDDVQPLINDPFAAEWYE